MRVDRWRKEDYPAIQRAAAEINAWMMFADESGIRTDDHRGTTWGQVGQTPIVPRLGARYNVNLLSAITAQGEMRFMRHEGRVTAATFCAFLRRLVVGMDRPIVVIVDGHRIHGAKKVRQLLARLRLRPTSMKRPRLIVSEATPQTNEHEAAPVDRQWPKLLDIAA